MASAQIVNGSYNKCAEKLTGQLLPTGLWQKIANYSTTQNNTICGSKYNDET